MAAGGNTIQRALDLLRVLPRVTLGNVKGSAKNKQANRKTQRGSKTHGSGSKGSKARQNFMRVGYETGNNPFYLRFPREPYYENHHLRRQYPPVSLQTLQLMIDTERIDPNEPIDLATFCNTKLYHLVPRSRHFGVHLTLDGVDNFKAKVNIEVQRANEAVIAAVERNGGVITTAYFDIESLIALCDPLNFFRRGIPIPRRELPPQELVDFYTNPRNRGYLADPDLIAEERFKLAQKFGYVLKDLNADPDKESLLHRKDPRQVYFGLEPGWIISLRDKVILKPRDEELREFYKS
uniref:Large ribosomal subunit protein uL15m n=1 Tax=Strigamia maritima TaxID=126957 RepID=T1IRT1_STRMM